jgi:uncharacterized membrane-anchored protein
MTADIPGLALTDIEEAEKTLNQDHRAPWYVETFLAVGGWIAGLFAAGAIFAFVAAILPDSAKGETFAAVALMVGAGFALAGTWLGRRRQRDFARHFAIAAIAAGLTAAIGGFWYLVSSALENFGGPSHELARIGYAGLVTSLAAAAVSTIVARTVRDGILSFLTTLAIFAVAMFSASALNIEHAVAPSIYWLVAPASALAGLIVFTRPFGRGVFTAVGAALMIGPMLYFDGLRNFAETFGIAPPTRFAGYAGEAMFAAGAVYCLAALRKRYPFYGLVAAAIILFAGIMLLPNAGDVAILILLAGFAANHRGLAAIGVVALAWFISRFYYDLSLTLLEKSAIMAGLGAASLAGAFALQRLAGGGRQGGGSPGLPSAPRRSLLLTLGFGAAIAGALVLINQSVWRLESEFREARVIFLPLGPSDPRSLIQGDYMTLIFRQTIYPPFEEAGALPDQGEVFLALDAGDIASFSRVAAPGEQPGDNEIRVDYARDPYGSIQYCPASFFFQEGDAAIYARARFAVVLVAPGGKTRLVDLADETRKVIDPDTEIAPAGPRQ